MEYAGRGIIMVSISLICTAIVALLAGLAADTVPAMVAALVVAGLSLLVLSFSLIRRV